MKSNKYVLKALDAYPFNLEEAAESLEYALSYDNEDTTALCLMGRMHAEILQDFDRAKEYFLEALAVDVHAKEIYPHYINVLIWNEDYADAANFIDFALKVKGTDKSWLYYRSACLQEEMNQLKKAQKTLAKAKAKAVYQPAIRAIEEVEERIKTKIKNKKSKKAKTKSKKQTKN